MAQAKIRTADIIDGQVTLAKQASIATNSLIGRATAGTGVPEVITLGTNLSFTGTTLNATGGSGGATTPYAEVPAGLLNGTNTVFTLANTPSNGLGVIVVLDGVTQYNGVGKDYTVSGTTITFAVAPSALTETIFAYYGVLVGGGVPDGDKGDITVSASGVTWTIDNGVVSLAKMANLATSTLIGRATAGAGVPEAITIGSGLTLTGTTLSAAGGGGDMILANAQTVTGAKTFNNGTFLLRNVANTFNGSFTNTNTADRIYTLKDAAGTIAFTSDITGTNSGTNTGDQTTIVGITGTKAQFNTALTDGDFLYVGDVTTPTLQQVLTAGTTLTGFNSIAQGVNIVEFSSTNTSGGGGVQITNTNTISANALSVYGQGANSLNVENYKSDGLVAIFTKGSGTNNAVDTVIKIQRIGSGTAANGIGSSIDLYNGTSTGAIPLSNKISSLWTDATHASRTSEFRISGVSNAVESNIFALKGTGQLQLNNYLLTSSFTGTPVGHLAFDASGNILTVAVPSGGGGITASSTDTFTNKSIALSGNTLTGTKALFNTALTDGDFLFVGDVSTPTLSQVLTAGNTAATQSIATFTHALAGGATLRFNQTTGGQAEVAGYTSYLNNAAGDGEFSLYSSNATVAAGGNPTYGLAIWTTKPTGQLQLPYYQTTTSFTGTAVGILAFDSLGRILTMATPSNNGITASSTDTLTNKSIALGTNTITGTKAQFNTALTDGDFLFVGDVSSGITRTILNISTATTAGAAANTDYVYFGTGTFTLTMPTAVGNTNRYTLKNNGTEIMTIAFTGAETGQGDTILTLLSGDGVELISDNANWFIVAVS